MLSCVLYRDHRAWWSHFLFTIWACGAEGAYLICNQKVVGSNPTRSMITCFM